MPNYRKLYTKTAGVLATVIEELDLLSVWAKSQQQAQEDVIIEKEPSLKILPLEKPPEEKNEKK